MPHCKDSFLEEEIVKNKTKAVIGAVLLLSLLIAAGCSKQSNTKTSAASGEGSAAVSSNPLSDIRVRQAIAYAIDKQALIESLLQGKAVAANALMPNDDWKAP